MNGTERNGQRSKLGPAVAIVSTTALACGVCCVMPFVLPAAVLALGGGVLAWFASSYRLMTYLSVAAVARRMDLGSDTVRTGQLTRH